MSPNFPGIRSVPRQSSSRASTAAGTGHFQEFARVHLKAGPCTDFMAVPGGIEPMTLADDVPKDFNFFRRRLEALVDAHGTRRIVIIAHQDCAGIARGWRRRTPEVIRARQIADMRRAAAWLRARFEGVTSNHTSRGGAAPHPRKWCSKPSSPSSRRACRRPSPTATIPNGNNSRQRRCGPRGSTGARPRPRVVEPTRRS